MKPIFAELRRRNVIRVTIAYVLMAWVALQGADFALDLIGAPGWVIRTLTILAAIGLPIALVIAWAFELTPEGLKRDRDVDRAQSIARKTGRRLDRIIIAFLALAVIALLADRLVDRPQTDDANLAESVAAVESPKAGNAKEPTSDKSVAVLPFVALSSGEDDGYFADGLTEEILNSLASLPDLLVTARTSSFYFKGKDVPVTEIADMLGVAHVVEGSVRRAGDKIRVTAQFIRASDGFHLWSQTYDRPLEDVFEIQTDVAEKVAGALSIYLDDEQREALAASGTRNVEAFKAFLKGRALLNRAHASETGVSLWDANEEFERAMALDPEYVAPAIAHHDAFAHYLMDGPGSEYLKEPAGRGPASEEDARRRLLAARRAAPRAPSPAGGRYSSPPPIANSSRRGSWGY